MDAQFGCGPKAKDTAQFGCGPKAKGVVSIDTPKDTNLSAVNQRLGYSTVRLWTQGKRCSLDRHTSRYELISSKPTTRIQHSSAVDPRQKV
ncbi:hypothetical protein J6590_105700 [Homalodisca vitripennis]|nr:hypothetical protein J6590_105700 [Homalodisca vitripennis]